MKIAIEALKEHWPEYLMEGAELGFFMISACLFTALLFHPASPITQTISSVFIRRMLTGTAMGLTLLAIVFSPLGKQTGAHLNPSFTWTFFRLGKVRAWDAVFYSLSQFAGGIGGVLVAAVFIRSALSHPAVNFAVTVPGPNGTVIAFFAELMISFFLMLTVLTVSNHATLSKFTPFFAAFLVATYITFEGPFSGMSMNPARTFASAFPARVWNSLWIYFLAPPLGMLAAGETYVRIRGIQNVFCAKYHHHNNKRCIFQCNFDALVKLERSGRAFSKKNQSGVAASA